MRFSRSFAFPGGKAKSRISSLPPSARTQDRLLLATYGELVVVGLESMLSNTLLATGVARIWSTRKGSRPDASIWSTNSPVDVLRTSNSFFSSILLLLFTTTISGGGLGFTPKNSLPILGGEHWINISPPVVSPKRGETTSALDQAG